MPLSINVGLSRKASRDYQSSGVSINVVAELDATLLAKPDELQQQIEGLYQQAEHALARQAGNRPVPSQRQEQQQRSTDARSNERRGNGRGNDRGNGAGRFSHGGNGSNGGDSPATDSQRRCINSIATRLNIDPHLEARDIVGTELEALSIKEASELIDHLKAQQPVGNGRNGGGR